MTPSHWLIADIGGTNSRLAVWQSSDGPRGQIDDYASLRNADFDTIDDMLAHYLDGLAGARPTGGLLAIAGPITGDALRLLNIEWSFSIKTLSAKLNLEKLVVLNDFEALAHVLPVLGDSEYVQIGGGEAVDTAPSVLVGPGTGLGVASLVLDSAGHHIAVAGEGGHVSMAATSHAEAAIIEAVRHRFGHCSAERLLSGAGISTLHGLLHGETLDAATISKMAHDEHADALATFAQFFLFLGTVASNLALTLGARGGVYIGGGIVPANRVLFERSAFRERFLEKGRYKGYLEAIPTRLIISRTPALDGLSALLQEHANDP
ncbi:MAG: glucokinase [Pseudomonadota bacterium]